MRVLVSGASGLIGRAVVAELVRRGHQVSTLQRGPGRGEPGVERHFRSEICAPAALEAAASTDGIIHLAGRGDVEESWREPADYQRVLVGGTLNLLEGARRSGAITVMASTQRVYRPGLRPRRESDPVRPADPYALLKLTAEGLHRLYAARYGLPARVVRLFSVYGPGQRGQGSSGVVGIFVENALHGSLLRVDSGPRRDFTYVDDAARGLCLALEARTPRFALYNVATGAGTSLAELAGAIVELTHSRSEVALPPVAWSGGDLVADLSRARRRLGYRPEVGLEEGLRRVIARASRTEVFSRSG